MGITGTFEGYSTSPLYLFNNGSYGGGQTGFTNMQLNGQYNISGGYIKCATFGNYSDSGYILFRFNNTTSLNNYNYIKLNGMTISSSEWDSIMGSSNSPTIQGGYGWIGLSSSSTIVRLTDSNIVSKIESKFNSGSSQVILNVSSISGNYYIYFAVKGSESLSRSYIYGAKINQIFLSST